jgi:23S rRNA pseudouridine2604 synthase
VIHKGVRINKHLADTGVATRRDADRLIADGLVLLNGNPAKLGDRVMPRDVVTVKKLPKKEHLYFLYHKPRGVMSHSAPDGAADVQSTLRRTDIFPLGRLDKDSSGLMILTNDGRLTDRILNPKYEHEKEYIVELDRAIHDRDLRRIERGINIEGYVTKPAVLTRLGTKKIGVVITEGKKHQVRRMFAAVGCAVRSLRRIRIAHLELDNLGDNELRPLTQKEQQALLTLANLR